MNCKLVVAALISALSSFVCWAQSPIASMSFNLPTGINQEAMVCSPVTLRFYGPGGYPAFANAKFYLDISLPAELEAFDNGSCSGAPNPMTTPQIVAPFVYQYAFSVRSYAPIAEWLKVATTTPPPIHASLWINIYHIPPAEISFATAPLNQPVGLCMAFPFQFLSAKGVAVVVRDPHRLELIKPEAPQTVVFSDYACSNPLAEMTVPAGQRGGVLYARLDSEPDVPIQLYDAEAVLLGEATAHFDEVRYTDVGVIININSDDSINVGHYFARKHKIPSENIFYIDAVLAEIITSSKFDHIRSQLEAQLLSQDPDRKLNYLVTTKGFPLAVDRDSHSTPSSTSASVESEIGLLLSDQAGFIGLPSTAQNRYYLADAPFKRGPTGAFLVTRLDAYTVDQVYDLIDRAGPAIPVAKATSHFVLDQDPVWQTFAGLNEQLSQAALLLSGRGFSTELNTTTAYVTDRQNVLGYTSWGSNDYTFLPYFLGPSLPNFQWLPGSIAETYVSTSARSFMPGTPYGQSLVADLLSEGIGGVKGYVFEPQAYAIARMAITFDRYTRGYNLAESFAAGSSRLNSWMDVIIGDPKMSILPSSE